ncbi:hypothetical protein FIBSPDRAFT_856420 [Athelia psychrophila]|uniref:Uncharacterized protein n=1 Tax=Athelia psychrophila TaxID=1759441 RepID=A0A166NIA9_9AGAM|nr:hypothetical protein FIBSPDRAFT_856420 [Fibularhizoctonia sp. CBS 109695]
MSHLHGSVGAIVFFAIFVFFTCATVVYYERHRSRARRLLLLRAAGFGRQLGDGFAPGEVPVLWDVWTQRAVGGEEKLLWDQIVPFSASVVHDHADPPLNPSPQPSPERAADRVVQVVVTIAMPSPHDYADLVERDPSGEVREWHIGIAELPWSSDQSVDVS